MKDREINERVDLAVEYIKKRYVLPKPSDRIVEFNLLYVRWHVSEMCAQKMIYDLFAAVLGMRDVDVVELVRILYDPKHVIGGLKDDSEGL